MDRVSLSPTLDLSRIVYGMWRLADDDNISPAHVQAKIEACLAQGITSFDQADIYGGYTSEAVLGSALRAAPALRDQMQIITKCGIVAPAGRYADARVKYYDTSRAHIEKSVEYSLREMEIEHIDLLLIHRPDPFMDADETGAVLDDMVASGKVGHVGVSNFLPADMNLLQSRMSSTMVTNQIEISLLASDPFRNGALATLMQAGVATMAWSPLAGGALFAPENSALHDKLATFGEKHDVDASAVAVAWLLAHPARILPVMGTNSLARIARLSEACKVEMSREDWFDFYTAALGQEVP
ncbi:aldo/keto reductase family oxidoreductase [Meridianimarinicoccus sp. MJW13]|uniref:aldo/keto reductase n=1 Tax=Meridianimarinicoccus sp. MJW13 TaxID=2720031 RepID=UPI0018663C5E|nr:aldo/keto reductase [Fluviibacterium sp. MJW13]